MRPTRTTVTLAAVGLLAAGCWTVAEATGASAAPAKSDTLSFFIQDSKQASVDAKPKGLSQGDVFTYHGLVYDSKGGKRIGRFGGACVLLAEAKGVPADSSCNLDYVLPAGQLHTEIFGASALLFSGQPFEWSVLGGTGKYAGARGAGTMRIPRGVKNRTDGYVRVRLLR